MVQSFVNEDLERLELAVVDDETHRVQRLGLQDKLHFVVMTVKTPTLVPLRQPLDNMAGTETKPLGDSVHGA